MPSDDDVYECRSRHTVDTHTHTYTHDTCLSRVARAPRIQIDTAMLREKCNEFLSRFRKCLFCNARRAAYRRPPVTDFESRGHRSSQSPLKCALTEMPHPFVSMLFRGRSQLKWCHLVREIRKFATDMITLNRYACISAVRYRAR